MFRFSKTEAFIRTVMAVCALAAVIGFPLILPAQRAAQSSEHPSQPLAFIVNKSNPVNNLSHQELMKLFLGERGYWRKGRKVTVVMQEEGMEGREAASRQVYRMTESDYNRYVLQAAFTGNLQSGPKLLSSEARVVKFISFVTGAIGYVRLSEVDDSVKVLKIDGLAPDDAAYKFYVERRREAP